MTPHQSVICAQNFDTQIWCHYNTLVTVQGLLAILSLFHKNLLRLTKVMEEYWNCMGDNWYHKNVRVGKN